MRTARLILAAGAIACAVPTLATAQPAPPVVVAPDNTVLTVSAEGRSLRQPDLAVFTAGVTTQGQTAAGALGENSRAMERVIAALRRAGIAERDIQTSNLSISPIYTDPDRDAMMAARASGEPFTPLPPEQRVRRIIGYQASNTVSVRQRDVENFGRVIDTLAGAGANQINGPSFQLDDNRAALDEARIDAMRNAKARAELYARATGLSVQRILSISETGGYYGSPPVAFARMASADAAAPPPPAPVQPGELQLTANVVVLYELAPR